MAAVLTMSGAACSLLLDTDSFQGDGVDGGREAGNEASVTDDGGPRDATVVEAAVDAGRTYVDEVLADSPVAYFRLGEKAGPFAKDEMSPLSGSFVGVVKFDQPGAIAGDANGAIRLEGGHISIVDTLAFPGRAPFTLEAWIKPSGVDMAYRRILSRERGSPNAGYSLFANANNVGADRSGGGGADSVQFGSSSLATDRFTHVVATYDGSALSLYVDGALVATTPAMRELADEQVPFAIGDYSGAPQAPFLGVIDEVAVYDKSGRTAADAIARIQAHHERARAGTP